MPSTNPLARYETTGFRFTDRDYYDRHVVFDHCVRIESATQRERFEAVARTLRDILAQRWVTTAETHDKNNPKQVYYLSLEFLIGRSMVNNIINLGVEQFVLQDLRSDPRQDWGQVLETEPDAGLGNGGLGRLAACFIDSLASLQFPAIGYGLRYDYGIFRQEIVNGYQVEHPDPWLQFPDPWEVSRPNESVVAPLAVTFEARHGELTTHSGQPMRLVGIPYDRPVVGYGGRTINTLRLWKAATPREFKFGEFSSGDFFGAVSDRVMAESVTRVLYPDDSTSRGRSLRFLQEYFLVRCSLADIVARFRRRGNDWKDLPDKVAIQLNDTHPAMAVAELMKILLDEAILPWEQAWDLTVRTLAYTNHTLLPEALEKWPVDLFATLLPRYLEIIYEINRRFLDEVREKLHNDETRLAAVSLIEEGAEKKVRMAHLAIVGTHSTNGVAAIHSNLLRTKTMPEFAHIFPQRFRNVTNGVTPRRWLKLANPPLAKLLTDAIGDSWIVNLYHLKRAEPLAQDPAFLDGFLAAKRAAKVRFVDWICSTAGIELNPDTIFDCQIKRIHEYKRQLLNVLQIVIWYNRLRKDPKIPFPPRTYLFAGKAAPAYWLAKVIIKLITSVARVVNSDSAVRDRLRVEFLPNYSCTLAEHLIPAADVSEQISTAGYEASGTSNMKFMMNGAITIGTRDGATVEIAEEVGEDNIFLFGLTADQVAANKGWYDPRWHYNHDPETREVLDMIFSGYFCRDEPGIFQPIHDTLLTHGDHYMHLADLTDYVATQGRIAALYRNRSDWAKMAALNVIRSCKFSSDRSIAEYAKYIWGAVPCPMD